MWHKDIDEYDQVVQSAILRFEKTRDMHEERDLNQREMMVIHEHDAYGTLLRRAQVTKQVCPLENQEFEAVTIWNGEKNREEEKVTRNK